MKRFPHLLHHPLSTISRLNFSNASQTYIFRCNRNIEELSKLGQVDGARKLFDEMTHRDSVTWNSMISGYVRSNRLGDAQKLFDSSPCKNVRTWTALLTGYAKTGRIQEARWVFDSMPERNVVTWNAMISAYVQNGDLICARKLFDEMPERNVASWNSVVTGYCHAGMTTEARVLFDQMPEKNLVSWMVMISGHVNTCCFRKAWATFMKMHSEGLMPDQSVFVVTLSAAAGMEDLVLVEILRVLALKTGFEGDVVVGTAILNAYTRSSNIDDAMNFFKTMPERNDYSWSTAIAACSQSDRLNDAIALYEKAPKKNNATQNAMLTAYAQNGRIEEAKEIFDEIQNPDVVAWNAIISGFAQNGRLEKAKDMFMSMPIRNSASWAAMIAGLVHNGHAEEALHLFCDLQRSGDVPNHSCFTTCLCACGNLGAVETGKQIHGLAIKRKYQYNPYVGNGLISMYAKCKNLEDVSLAFSSMGTKDTVSWNSLISGLSKNDMLEDAYHTFEKMPDRDVVSWTAIISAHVQAGHVYLSMQMFLRMLERGLKPNQLTITSVISACGSFGSSKLGEQIHSLVFKLGFNLYLFVNNSLISMYFKCGLEDGFCVFEDMPEKDIITWNAVLAGCAQNGLGREAITVFERMRAEEGVSPDEVSFLGVLCACSRAGLLHEGRTYFNSMCQEYGITPSIYHFTCMVDLLGRAGRFLEAEELIESMPIEPDSVIWEALLGACKIHRNMEVGERVAKRLSEMDALTSGTYVLLSNMYASQGRWEKVRETRKLMKSRGVSKEPGISWIQIRDKIHSFLTADKTHENIGEIHAVLKEYCERVKVLGYVPETNFVLHDVDEEQKEDDILYHSEKLAVVYGILNTSKGSPIQVMKNLRICGDCHSFMKFMSVACERKIVIRDGIRYHHFVDGVCTCGDYW